jgi:hypothetical protein
MDQHNTIMEHDYSRHTKHQNEVIYIFSVSLRPCSADHIVRLPILYVASSIAATVCDILLNANTSVNS